MREAIRLWSLLAVAAMLVGPMAARADVGVPDQVVAIGSGASGMAFDGENLWVALRNEGKVAKVRAFDGAVLATYEAGPTPDVVLHDGRSVWITNHLHHSVTKLRAATGAFERTVAVGEYPLALAYDGTNVWVTTGTSAGTLTRLRPSDGAVLNVYPVGSWPSRILYASGHLWITQHGDTHAEHRLRKVRPADAVTVTTLTHLDYPYNMAFDGTSVWVGNGNMRQLLRVRALDGAIDGAVPFPVAPNALAYDGPAIWVTNTANDLVHRLRVSDGVDTGSRQAGAHPEFALFDGTDVWVTSFHTGTLQRYHSDTPSNVLAMGLNAWGQVGDGTVVSRTKPARAVLPRALRSIHAGKTHSLGVTDDGSLFAWGDGAFGKLGNGGTDNRALPAPVIAMSDAVAASAGGTFSLAIRSDGTVWSWGRNLHGQLGDGTQVQRLTPVQVQGLPPVVAVAGGDSHSLALDAAGTVWSWGWNAAGQLGRNAGDLTPVPAPIPGIPPMQSIAAGGNSSAAVSVSGELWTWGMNDRGQLGDGTRVNRQAPQPVGGLGPVRAVDIEHLFTVALAANGTVWAWGDGGRGNLGNGDFVDSNVPVAVANLDDVVEIGAGSTTAIALRADGTIWQWGALLTSDGAVAAIPQLVPGMPSIRTSSLGSVHLLTIPGQPANPGDSTPPTLTVPGPTIAEALGPSGASVTFAVQAADDRDPSPAVTCTPASGLVFPLGATVVTCTATDAAGNQSEATFTVEVRDRTAPSLTVPTGIVTAATSASGAVVSFEGLASDVVDPDPAVECSPVSGSLFAPGTTTVSCTATDDAGNQAAASFPVQVVYGFDGFLPPIGGDGSSLFRLGRTIPVKFRLQAGGVAVPGVTATLHVYRYSDHVYGTVEILTDASGGSNVDNLFRYDPAAGQYVYNLQTSAGFQAGTYMLRAALPDGTLHDVLISLR